MSNLLVRDLMTQDVAAVREDCAVHDLERVLLEHHVHGVPVIDGNGRLSGVVSQTDLIAWHFNAAQNGAPFYEIDDRYARGPEHDVRLSKLRRRKVREVMSSLLHAIEPDRPVAEAARRMVAERIHRLIVVNAEFHVVGVISALDLLRRWNGPKAAGPSA
jgi:CBS-domain-containing membrane protein